MEHCPLNEWNIGKRVQVTRGEHAGRVGTVTMLPSDEYASLVGLTDGHVRVSLDGEAGQVAAGPGSVARGGRGGVAIVIADSDLAAARQKSQCPTCRGYGQLCVDDYLDINVMCWRCQGAKEIDHE